jgi:hypothetical protein
MYSYAARNAALSVPLFLIDLRRLANVTDCRRPRGAWLRPKRLVSASGVPTSALHDSRNFEQVLGALGSSMLVFGIDDVWTRLEGRCVWWVADMAALSSVSLAGNGLGTAWVGLTLSASMLHPAPKLLEMLAHGTGQGEKQHDST